MENLTQTAKIKKVLFNEISLCIAGVGLVSSMIFWVMNPQQEMAMDMVRLESQLESNEQVGVMLQKFKDNDLHEMQLKLNQVEDRQIDIMKGLSRIEALIER